jgi:hypothetical protein
MTIESLMEEHDLVLDDIRWYLASRIANTLLSQSEHPEEITRRVWSGALEGELYNMEERFLERLQDELERGLLDEQAAREHFSSARMLKMRRR